MAKPGICYKGQRANITKSILLGLRFRCSSAPQFLWLFANLKNPNRLGHHQGHKSSRQWHLIYSTDQDHLWKMGWKCQFMVSTIKDPILVYLECKPGLPFLFSFCCLFVGHVLKYPRQFWSYNLQATHWGSLDWFGAFQRLFKKGEERRERRERKCSLINVCVSHSVVSSSLRPSGL